MLAHLIRDSYQDVAEQLELKQWYVKLGFVEQEIKTFTHLPFKVSLLTYAF